MDALQGNVAGLQVINSSGSPDATPEFRIRGFTKKGSQGKATVSLDAKLGWSSRSSKRYDTIDDPAEYIETYYSGLYRYYRAQGQSPPTWPTTMPTTP